MIEYADYTFYKNEYRGNLSSNLFNSLIPKASREIDKIVNRELQEVDIDNKVKFVACELVDFLNKYDSINGNGNISSKSIDGVSKTYNTLSKNEINQEKNKIYNGLPHELTRFL